MDDHPHEPNIEELAGLGLYDPAGPDAGDRLELLRYVLARGATVEQIAASRSLGDLALDLNLRSGPWLELGEVVATTGLEWDDAVRLLTALGFPAYGRARHRRGGRSDPAPRGGQHTPARSRGDGPGGRRGRHGDHRIADALVGAFRLRFELPRLQGGSAYSDVVKEYSRLTEEVLPGFVQTLDVLLQRQLIAVADRVWSTEAERSVVTLARTVGFADLVGYTAASATMSVGELAGVLAEFDERVSGIVHRGNGNWSRRWETKPCSPASRQTTPAGLPSTSWRTSLWENVARTVGFEPAMSSLRLATSTDPTSTWPP